MSLAGVTTIRAVLYESDGAEMLPGEKRFAAARALLERGYAVTQARDPGQLSPLPRTRQLVFAGASAPRPPGQPADEQTPPSAWRDLGDADPARLVAEADQFRDETQAFQHGAWKPWFPVIDYDRCTNCMQCLSFCLFGVYGVDAERRLRVQNQENCKTNCPACSRVCPEAAIMFPKYKAGPINGDVVSDADLNREKMKIDISALLGGDVYDLLRARSERARTRFSKERDADKALSERQKCLTKLAGIAADVPPEVLMSLPSPDEIARRAQEAHARAQAALSPATPQP
jgi:Pyruvate/2-oxoacid:ferredoxin oxidoreductase delta subunit